MRTILMSILKNTMQKMFCSNTPKELIKHFLNTKRFQQKDRHMRLFLKLNLVGMAKLSQNVRERPRKKHNRSAHMKPAKNLT